MFSPLAYWTAFWDENPALFVGIALCLSICLAFFGLKPLWIPLFFFLLLLAGNGTRLFLFAFLAFCGFFYASAQYCCPNVEPGFGLAEIQLTHRTTSSSEELRQPAFLRSFWKRGKTDEWELIARNLPVTVRFASKMRKIGPLDGAACDTWIVTAQMKRGKKGRWRVEIPVDAIYWPKKRVWGFLSLQRLQIREKVEKIVSDHLQEGPAQEFLLGLLVGQKGSFELTYLFQRFGLQHILAISGFHFSVVSGVFLLFGQCFLPYWWNLVLSLGMLGLYSFVVGPYPSVLRAWVMASLALASVLLGRPSSSLNRLGIALCVVLVCVPSAVLDVGFWLSFCVTGSILLFLPTMGFAEFSFTSKGFTRWFWFLCKLSAAVHVVALPLTLFYFHRFPLWGLVYNLFFPLLVAGSIWLAVIGLVLAPFSSFAAHLVLKGAERYTIAILVFPELFPEQWDVWVSVGEVPLWSVQVVLCLSFLAGILWRGKVTMQRLTPFA